ncbi:MAG: Uncharacterised protein [Flavobacteriales bacterium]|nr:MAG: Uncharacterised protein [Flavobacteriales bacterium]
MTMGTNVMIVFAALKIVAASPINVRWVKSLAKMVIEPPACSNAHQKKIVKMEKIIITNSRSNSVFVKPVLVGVVF